MALLQPPLGAPTTPKIHTRGYYVHKRSRRPTLSTRRHAHKLRHCIPTPAQLATYGGTQDSLNKAYTSLIGHWWASGNTGLPKIQWADLAASNQIDDGLGALKKVDTYNFFLWYQRRILAANGWLNSPYNPNPYYSTNNPSPGILYFPAIPRYPWSWPDPCKLAILDPSPPNQIWIEYTPPTAVANNAMAFLYGTRALGANQNLLPSKLNYSPLYYWTHGPGSLYYTMVVLANDAYPARLGEHWMFGWYNVDLTTQCCSRAAYINFTWGDSTQQPDYYWSIWFYAAQILLFPLNWNSPPPMPH